jgi:hypothetical protein
MASEEQQPSPSGEPGAGQGEPDQEELRRRLEEQLKKVRVQDMLLESVASILNLSARRIAKEDERDLDQARLGIDAVRALVDMLEPEPRSQVQTALSEVQMMYAREAGGGERPQPEHPSEPGGARPPRQPGGEPGARRRPGRGRGSGLWTPPGST